MSRRNPAQSQPSEPPASPTADRPAVALVGRPNVGKSALFNRMLGGRKALVEEAAGTTRDRVYGDVEWRGKSFRIIDTGGLLMDGSLPYSDLVRAQVETAAAEAEIILFVVDGKDGLTAADRDVAERLRSVAKPVLLVANKTESEFRRESVVEFYELGLGDPIAVSALHGMGVGDLMDMLTDMLPETPEVEPPTALSIAIVGRPNVGKSMLTNTVLGEERVIVSETPGTTRDSIDTPFEYGGHKLTLIDTAGIRRRGRVEAGVERHSVMRAQAAAQRADVALVVIDAAEGLTAQDAHIAGLVADGHVGMVLVANKWDLSPPEPVYRKEFSRILRHRLRFAPWAPLCFVSAKEGTGIDAMLTLALRVGEERRKRLPTAEVNAIVQRAIGDRSPPSTRGRKLKVLYVTQAQSAPPTFVFFVNDASLLHFSYQRYLENQLRKTYGFEGTPLKLVFKSRGER
ncbi:MAG: ribosome biogenesis GTPase Der [Planctomycetes bacterium]|nr:ribosome biogenesis GTPase Der [Planctomycetota bacterium]